MKQNSKLNSSMHSKKKQPVVMLVDNGSLRPQAVFGLRKLAATLSKLIALDVEPISLLHSHKIPAEKLEGVEATIVKRRLKKCVTDGDFSVVIIPAFIGPSLAITEYLPEVIAEIKKDNPKLEVAIAKPLCGANYNEPDHRLAEILFDHVSELSKMQELQNITVAAVDHGTPIKEVNTVRNLIAKQLEKLLKAHFKTESHEVIACSMERREGEQYAFNDPLLENINPVDKQKDICLLAMLFILPGRHAGEGGDVAEICNGLINKGSFSEIKISKLIAEHPLLPQILKERFERARIAQAKE